MNTLKAIQRLISSLLIVALLAGCGSFTTPDPTIGRVEVTVTQDGNPAPNIKITFSGSDKEVRTNDSGQLIFEDLKPGDYMLSIEAMLQGKNCVLWDILKVQAGDHLTKAYDLNKPPAGILVGCK